MKTFILLLSILIINSSLLFSQVFTPFRKLNVIKTEKFDIIFPEESRRTAEYIYSFIDDMYEENSKKLNSKVYGRIAITITPDLNIFNSIAYPAPYPAIIIYDTPMGSEFTTYEQNMYGVLLHELMHLISLSSENGGFQTRIFGTWLSLVFVNATYPMIEGVAVSFESLNGFGRANDPFVKERVRQDIREDNFKNPYQATFLGKYPYGNTKYEYGGLFSKYLIDKYGMEKYAEFWKQIQSKLYISLYSYKSGLYNFFYNVYEIEFLDAWNDFKQSMTIVDIENNNKNKLSKKETLITSTASFESKLYYVDSSLAKLKVYNTSDDNKKIKTVITIPQSTDTIDISDDGETILLSSYITRNGFTKYIIREYSLKNKKYTKLKIEDAHSARYFRNGVIAISKNLYNSTLIYINENGEKEILLPPNEKYSYQLPVKIDDNKIALIVVENGIKSIRILDYENNTLSKVGSTLSNNDAIWKYVKNLNYSKGKILFSFNDDDRFYKLGVLDINSNKLMFYQTDYSGGVFNAVEVKEDIYYKARFSEYEAIMKYPKSDEFISSEIILTDTISVNGIENEELTFVPNENIKTDIYYGINYIKPWVAWIPLPLTNQTYEYFFNGIGLYTYIQTPTTENTAIISLGYDIPSTFMQGSVDYTTLSLAYPLRIVVDNMVIYSSAKYWQTSAFVSMTFYEDIFDDNNRISISPAFMAVLFSEARNINDHTSAFYWKYNDWAANTALTLNYTYYVRGLKYLSVDRISLSIRPMYSILHEVFRIDSTLKLQSQLLPLRLSFYSAYSPNAKVGFDGTSRIFGGFALAKGQDEFHYYVNSTKPLANWFIGGELELIKGFSIEEHFGSLLYFNELILSASYKGSYYYDEYLHSLAVKVGTKLSILTDVIGGEPFITLALKLPNSKETADNYFSNIGANLYFGFGLGVSW